MAFQALPPSTFLRSVIQTIAIAKKRTWSYFSSRISPPPYFTLSRRESDAFVNWFPVRPSVQIRRESLISFATPFSLTPSHDDPQKRLVSAMRSIPSFLISFFHSRGESFPGIALRQIFKPPNLEHTGDGYFHSIHNELFSSLVHSV